MRSGNLLFFLSRMRSGNWIGRARAFLRDHDGPRTKLSLSFLGQQLLMSWTRVRDENVRDNFDLVPFRFLHLLHPVSFLDIRSLRKKICSLSLSFTLEHSYLLCSVLPYIPFRPCSRLSQFVPIPSDQMRKLLRSCLAVHYYFSGANHFRL